MAHQPRTYGDTPRHVHNVDWDGCAVPAMWPERPEEFHSGFGDAMERLRVAGHVARIHTARINPRDPWTGKRRPDEQIAAEVAYIRSVLDKAGLTFVEIYTADGKPGGSTYIDDKAERYNPGPRSWARLIDKVLLRLEGEAPIFPHITEEVPS
jgi:hypothetical protein